MYNYLEVSTKALHRNAEAVVRYVGVPVIGVVKCDGYGMSTVVAAKAWLGAGATMLAVSQPEDACKLRLAGIQADILMLSPVADIPTLSAMEEADVILPVTSLEVARFYAGSCSRPIRVHVAVDTGMGRFGIRWTDISQLTDVYQVSGLRFEGIYSHFSSSFEKRYSRTKLQLGRFLQACDRLRESGCPLGLRHIANSCAALRFPETRLDAVRIGSALVGTVCGPIPLVLEHCAVCKAQVVDRRTFLPGDRTGYASVCKVRSYTEAIIVAVGHENGAGWVKTPDHYPPWALAGYLYRLLKLRLHPPCVTADGHRLKLVGRLGNQFSIFEAEGSSIQVGDYVEVKANLMFPWKRRLFV